MKKISLIIPHYNSPAMLEKMLDSAVSEAVDEQIQIIVVDDNSTKDKEIYEDVVKKFLGRVEFYTNDTGKQGAGTARNVGLSKASGEFVMFADADDCLLPGWYGIVSEYFDKDYDIVFFNTTSAVANTGKTGKRHILYSDYVDRFVASKGSHDEELHLRYFFVVPWGKIIRTGLIRDNDIRFDDVRFSNDVMFSEKTGLNAKSITADARPVYCVTESEGGLSAEQSKEAWLIRNEVFCRRNYFLAHNLTKKDYSFCKKRMGAYLRLEEVLKRKGGFSMLGRYLKMYARYDVPLFYSFLHEMKCRLSGKVKNR